MTTFYDDDINRIIKVMRKEGIKLSKKEAKELWEKVSNDIYFAGWLCLHEEDKDIVDDILEIMENDR